MNFLLIIIFINLSTHIYTLVAHSVHGRTTHFVDFQKLAFEIALGFSRVEIGV